MKRFLLGLCALATLTFAGVHSSDADFQGTSANAGNAFGAAIEFYEYGVALGDPGTPLNASVTLTATVSGADAALVTSVRFERSPASAGTWTTVCTDPVPPYSCAFDTTAASDGLHDLRAVATDPGNDSRTSAVVASRRVDNTTPSVSLADPGADVRGTISLTGSASDGGSGLASIVVERSSAGAGTWTSVCTTTTSPYSCSLDTTTLADGLYDFRTTATDAAGNAATVSRTSRRVDNTGPSVTLDDAGANVRATISLTGTASDGGSGLASITVERSPAGTGTWTTVCTTTTSPYSCSLDTTTLVDGLYDFRTTATDTLGNTGTAMRTDRRIDNTAPSATLSNPGTGPFTGSKTFSGTASDGGSGIQAWKVQSAPAGSSSWTDACTSTTSPYSCSVDTTTIPDGSYDWRAVAVDAAGNTGASGAQTARRVDNTAPTVTLSDPGTPVRGTISFTATASDPAGGTIAQVVFQRSAAGANSWTTICTVGTSPYTCSYNTTSQVDGLYDFRALATDGANLTGPSGIVANRQVDNTAPTGADVQTANGGTTVGRTEAGDSITFTWSEMLAPSSVMAGWNGSAAGVTIRITNRNNINQGGDQLDVYNGANTAKLNITGGGLVSLGGDYVPNSGAVFAGTMVQSGSTITITLGALQSGGVQTLAALPGTMAWAVSSASADLAGNATVAATLNEPGFPADVEF